MDEGSQIEERAEGVGMSVEGSGGLLAREHRAGFSPAYVADIAFGACLACGSYGGWFFVPSTWEAINVVDGAPHKSRG